MSNPITSDSSSSNTQQTSFSPPLSFSHSLSSSPPSLSLTPINNEIDTQRKKGGCPHSVVWNYFNKGTKIYSGHYVADCKSCGKHWNKGSPTMMEHHLAFECPAINDSVKYAFLESVNQSNRRIQPSNQTGLEDFIE
ncbi:8372_t:CDS:1, partial [Entrophospora sp. SA101]